MIGSGENAQVQPGSETASAPASTLGVVLLNMGGPEALDEVEPFLRNLFADREIIRLGPWPWLQKIIARRIVKKRAPKSREAYRLIGGGSPLARISAEQGRALAARLAGRGDYMVRCAMRYWHPLAAETLAEFAQAGVSRLLALPLYPHYSRATTGSSLNDLKRAAAESGFPFAIEQIEAWPDHPAYIRALATTLAEGATNFAGEEYSVVYSAHSLPVSFIEAGDPYLEHIQRTIAALEKLTGLPGQLCFQSRSGPVRWLEPSTPDMLRQLAANGVVNVLMVPISFVSDHVETLYEIDIQYRELARSLGIRLVRPPALNTHPDLIEALAQLVP
ncbi:ferrochelatase [Desulfurivibrio alkaliphilus]|uniref:Ferrochelatase n=1 Tax=Desulfurivibrio alkaliphilus (strain DSM 19089 / UNIQEM U267 / AHT2) TaxID=589865 RepID=D6Z4Z3_DESAT|nr:ferrochelatase [Desulfurivibrio alkaliphilus]ADH86618.1 ferrochelatase [Desulfurivibrio alkaliphilus AHT 2]